MERQVAVGAHEGLRACRAGAVEGDVGIGAVARDALDAVEERAREVVVAHARHEGGGKGLGLVEVAHGERGDDAQRGAGASHTVPQARVARRAHVAHDGAVGEDGGEAHERFVAEPREAGRGRVDAAVQVEAGDADAVAAAVGDRMLLGVDVVEDLREKEAGAERDLAALSRSTTTSSKPRMLSCSESASALLHVYERPPPT